MGKYTTDGKISSLVTNIGPFPWEMVDLVQTASISLSTSSTSTLTVSVLDPDMELLSKAFLMGGDNIALGGQQFVIRVREMVMVSKQLALQVTAQSAGITALSNMRGNLVRANISATDYIAGDCKTAGLKFVGQPSAKQASIVRTKNATQNDSAWDVHQSLAQNLGYWLWESNGTVFFGQPTWLATNLPRYWVRWRGEATTDPIISVPLMRSSLDDNNAAKTGSFTVHPDAAEIFVPGVGIQLDGVGVGAGSMDGVYLVTDLSMDLDGKTPPTVTIQQPINQPPGTSSAVVVPPTHAGTYTATPGTVKIGEANPATGWTWPADGVVKGSATITASIYGTAGEPVVAPQEGTVLSVAGTTGPTVTISVGNGLTVQLQQVQNVMVKPGQHVSRGQQVAQMGAAGRVVVATYNGAQQMAPTNYFPALP